MDKKRFLLEITYKQGRFTFVVELFCDSLSLACIYALYHYEKHPEDKFKIIDLVYDYVVFDNPDIRVIKRFLNENHKTNEIQNP